MYVYLHVHVCWEIYATYMYIYENGHISIYEKLQNAYMCIYLWHTYSHIFMTYIFAYMSSIQVPYKFLPYGMSCRATENQLPALQNLRFAPPLHPSPRSRVNCRNRKSGVRLKGEKTQKDAKRREKTLKEPSAKRHRKRQKRRRRERRGAQRWSFAARSLPPRFLRRLFPFFPLSFRVSTIAAIHCYRRSRLFA